jgi:hypothetical protein
MFCESIMYNIWSKSHDLEFSLVSNLKYNPHCCNDIYLVISLHFQSKLEAIFSNYLFCACIIFGLGVG